MKNQSRREFMKGAGSVVGGTWLAANLPLVMAVTQTACARRDANSPWQNLTQAEAEGFAAIVDQIIPPDESPGAAEIGVVYFLDEVLNNFWSEETALLKNGLAELESLTRNRRPNSADTSPSSVRSWVS